MVSDVPPDIADSELLEYATEVSDELIDAIIFRLRGIEKMSHGEIADQLAEGFVFRDVVVCHQISRSQVWRRWKQILATEADPEEVRFARAEEVLALNHAQRQATLLLDNPRVEVKDRLAAARVVDRCVRTRAELLGLNAPKRFTVEAVGLDQLRSRAEQILAERLELGSGTVDDEAA